MLRYLILGLLRDGKAYHGYALMAQYRDVTGIKVAMGNVYRELQHLAGLGWIRSAPNPVGADARRVPYEITKQGVSALESWLLTPIATPRIGGMDELSLRTFLIARVAHELPAAVIDHWKEELALCRTILRREAGASQVRRGKSPDEKTTVPEALVVRRLRHIMTDLNFVEEVRAACGPQRAVSEDGSEGGENTRSAIRKSPEARQV